MRRLKGDRDTQRQPALKVNNIHIIAELEPGLLNTVYCHYVCDALTMHPCLSHGLAEVDRYIRHQHIHEGRTAIPTA